MSLMTYIMHTTHDKCIECGHSMCIYAYFSLTNRK